MTKTLGYLNLSFGQTFQTGRRHLSLKFSREFESLRPVNSDFTLTKVRNSRENLLRLFCLSVPQQASIFHFSACKLLHLSLIHVISMSFLCRFYVIKWMFSENVNIIKSID